MLLAGAIAAAAILYANSLLGYSILYASIAAAIAAIMVMRGLFGWQQRRFAVQLFRQLPDAIQLVTSTVRSGLPVHEAFRTIAREMPQPTAGQFAIVCSEVNLGRPPEEAVEAVYRRTQVAEYAMFAVTLAVQLKSGGSLAETLQTLGDTVRQRVALAARAKALAGEVIFFLTSACNLARDCGWGALHGQSAEPSICCSLIRLETSCWLTRSGLGACRAPGDKLDGQKGNGTMTLVSVWRLSHRGTATATCVLIIREMHIRALDARVSNAVLGVA